MNTERNKQAFPNTIVQEEAWENLSYEELNHIRDKLTARIEKISNNSHSLINFYQDQLEDLNAYINRKFPDRKEEATTFYTG